MRTFGAVKGKIGEITEVGASRSASPRRAGRIEVLRAKLGDGKKSDAADLITSGAIERASSSARKRSPSADKARELAEFLGVALAQELEQDRLWWS